MSDDGGRLIRDDMDEVLLRLLAPPPPWFRMPPAPPPTRRQRLRARLATIRWAIHNRLSPDCPNNEE